MAEGTIAAAQGVSRGSSDVRTMGLPLPLPLVVTTMAVAAAVIPAATAIAATSTLCHQASDRIGMRAGSRDVPDLTTGPAVGGGYGVGRFDCRGACGILIGPSECLGGPSTHCGASLRPSAHGEPQLRPTGTRRSCPRTCEEVRGGCR